MVNSQHVDWIRQRNASTKKAPFPFTNFRAGQRELARSVYRAVQNKINFFVEAPTGVGKTLATLYPTINALPLIADGKIFYLTAKTPGRLAAQDALQKLREIGVQVRSVRLTTKATILPTSRSSRRRPDVRTTDFCHHRHGIIMTDLG